MSAVSQALPLPEVYFNKGGGNYFVPDSNRFFIPMNETSAKRELRLRGFSALIPEGASVSPLDQILNSIQKSQHVEYAAPLAGYSAGLYDINGAKILVTKSPQLIEPVEGEFPILSQILQGMFNHGGVEQLPYVYGWLKVAITALRQQKRQLGQALAMAGPVRSAKSLFQSVITELLGGRASQPHSFMTGGTTFNGELFGAEHLMIEDVAESKDYRMRREFAAKIKALVANMSHSCHGKYKEALDLTPFWRVTISLNDDQERILVLPPIDADIEDKIILLRVARCKMPMPTETSDEQSAFWKAIKAELPAFVYFVLNWEIPNDMKSNRFGVLHYHHPDLLQMLKETTPEQTLAELIDTSLFFGGTGREWVGSASELTDHLAESNRSQAAKSLLRNHSSCGTYLGRLQKDYPDRISRRLIHGLTEWTIRPPQSSTPMPRASYASGLN